MKAVAYRGFYITMNTEEANGRTYLHFEITRAGSDEKERIGVSFKNEDRKGS